MLTCLRGNEFLEVADGIVVVALDPDLLAKPVVADDLDHHAAHPEKGTAHTEVILLSS